MCKTKREKTFVVTVKVETHKCLRFMELIWFLLSGMIGPALETVLSVLSCRLVVDPVPDGLGFLTLHSAFVLSVKLKWFQITFSTVTHFMDVFVLMLCLPAAYGQFTTAYGETNGVNFYFWSSSPHWDFKQKLLVVGLLK